MALDDLKETIETLSARIQAHRPYLEGNETRTRQALIDPMLRALGWDVENPDSVELEYSINQQRVDYALMGLETPVAVIEAKALGKPLDEKETMQALNYANTAGIPYMTLTNGDHWRMLEVFKQAPIKDRILMNFQLTQDEPYACALQALGIWRPNLASGEPPKEAITPVFAHHESATDQPEPSTPEPPSAAPSSGQEAVDSSESEEQNQDNWVPLESLEIKDKKPPANTKIKFPGSSIKPIKSWIDIWVSVAEHLIENGKISAEKDCPVRKTKKAKTYLLHTKPYNQDGRKFPVKKEIGDLWLFTNFSATNAYKTACWLLKEFGVNPSTVLVSTSPS